MTECRQCRALPLPQSAFTESLHLLAKIRGEADRPALRDRRVHELANGGEDGGNGFIVDGELFVEPDEGAHHVDAHFDRSRAA
jgi:hypothetical protein